MIQRPHQGIALDKSAVYCIRCQGELNASWSDYLGEMSISSADGQRREVVTTLEGRLPDQAALIGVLNALYTLGLALLRVELIEEPIDSERIGLLE